jgi:hypothetical protein
MSEAYEKIRNTVWYQLWDDDELLIQDQSLESLREACLMTDWTVKGKLRVVIAEMFVIPLAVADETDIRFRGPRK